VVERFTKIIKARGRNESTTAVQFFKSFGVAGKGGVITDKEIQTWVGWLEQVGQIPKGKLKASDIYTNKYNSFAGGAQ
jgi:hypothetical protein